MSRVLAILEVSQKQAYIFSSNKLMDNVRNSAVIAKVTGDAWFQKVISDPEIYDSGKNYVYAGGGHTVLEFDDREKARKCIFRITEQIHRAFPDIEIFAAVMEYDDSLRPAENLKNLSAQLEKKKAVRRATFHQGSFGVEQVDAATLKPMRNPSPEEKKAREEADQKDVRCDVRRVVPEGWEPVSVFEDIGITKDDSSFIAIVHIDGNGMGARIAEYYKAHDGEDWETFRKNIREYSDAIDGDFKKAFLEMNRTVVRQIESGALKDLNLKDRILPVRPLIASGDDICFVTEGRIGIECAVEFIRLLTGQKKCSDGNVICNGKDGKPYAACAGVAVVHQKYPFFRAYELAEELCSSAKRFGAALEPDGNGRNVSSVDWHIDMGELKETLDETRSMYRTADGGQAELRPYIIAAPEEVLRLEPYRRYDIFLKLMQRVLKKGDDNVRSRLKALRAIILRGKDAVQYYIDFNKLDRMILETWQDVFVRLEMGEVGGGEKLERRIWVETADSAKNKGAATCRSTLYDAIEIMDVFIPFVEEGQV